MENHRNQNFTLSDDMRHYGRTQPEAYRIQTRSMMQTDQQFAGINSLSGNVKENQDGSIDVIFSPEMPKGMENNWVQTIPGKSWFIILRAYGPLAPWIDKTWRPGGLELVE